MGYIKIRFSNDKTKSNFGKTIEDIFQTMNPMFVLSERTWKPQMDIYETPNEIIILGEIAGVDKENLELEINNKAIKIYGSRNQISRVENARYRLAEIQYGKFERILFFPTPIDMGKVKASYLNGFLQIRLAKLPVNIIHKIPILDE